MVSPPARAGNSWWCLLSPWPRIHRLWLGRRWLSATKIGKEALSRDQHERLNRILERRYGWESEGKRERERGGEGNLRGNFLPFIRWLKVGIVSRGTWEISFLGMYRDIVSYWKNVYGGGRWRKIFSPSLLCDLFLHAISKLLNREGISKV